MTYPTVASAPGAFRLGVWLLMSRGREPTRGTTAAGKVVHFHLHTNVDFTKLDEAARKNGMVPPLAGRRWDGSGS